MKYEIKIRIETIDGRKSEKSEMTSTCEMARRNGLDAIKYIKEGKSRYTWVDVPNEYQMKRYYKSFEVMVIEATTGKAVYRISK